MKQKLYRFIEFYRFSKTGVYDRFMSVTSMVNSYEESFTIKYIDILTNQVSILELE